MALLTKHAPLWLTDDSTWAISGDSTTTGDGLSGTLLGDSAGGLDPLALDSTFSSAIVGATSSGGLVASALMPAAAPPPPAPPPSPSQARPVTATLSARTVDGSGNNAAHATWGETGDVFTRLTPAHFADGISTPNDAGLPSARLVSNIVVAQSAPMPSKAGVSDLFWAWGQFIDHDLDLTATGGSGTLSIAVPKGDPQFDPTSTGTQTMGFTRATAAAGTGVTSARQYDNQITSYLDGSMIYGSDATTAAAVRDTGGKLKLDANGYLLSDGHGGVVAGDIRAAENVGLTALQTIFAREHNYQVDLLHKTFPTLTDDQLYSAARVRVEAEIQAVTYNEYLPLLLGRNAMPTYTGYNANTDAAVSLEFDTVAYRFAHSMVGSIIERLNADGSTSAAGNISVRDAFFRPDLVASSDGLVPILRGLSDNFAQNLDVWMVDDVRSFLFGAPGQGGMDLAALDIERARDEGIPSYNDMRAALGLSKVTDFNGITHDRMVAAALKAAYGTVDKVDAFIGGLAEDPVNGGQVGQLFYTIIRDQFIRTRDGDSQWSQKVLGAADANALWHTTLADIISRNSDIGSLQQNVLVAYNRVGGTDGADSLVGTNGHDLIIGGAGNDTISGGAGGDDLYGGAGADKFIFSGTFAQARIGDFAAGDVIDLRGQSNVHSLTDLRPVDSAQGLLLTVGSSGTIMLMGVHQIQSSQLLFA